jgi:hypothetical protein
MTRVPLFLLTSAMVRCIDFQMGQARSATRGTTRKSMALARPEARSIVPSAGPTRRPFSAWAATSAHWAGPKHDPIGGGAKAAWRQAWNRPDLPTPCEEPILLPVYKLLPSSFNPKIPPAPSHLPRAAIYLAGAPSRSGNPTTGYPERIKMSTRGGGGWIVEPENHKLFHSC